jgi:hypothetical protein
VVVSSSVKDSSVVKNVSEKNNPLLIVLHPFSKDLVSFVGQA